MLPTVRAAGVATRGSALDHVRIGRSTNILARSGAIGAGVILLVALITAAPAAAASCSGESHAPPTLSSGAATQATASTARTITFSVLYADAAGCAPTSIRLVIRGVGQFTMSGPRSGFDAGVPFVVSRSLPPGSWTYGFTATSGMGPGEATAVLNATVPDRILITVPPTARPDASASASAGAVLAGGPVPAQGGGIRVSLPVFGDDAHPGTVAVGLISAATSVLALGALGAAARRRRRNARGRAPSAVDTRAVAAPRPIPAQIGPPRWQALTGRAPERFDADPASGVERRTITYRFVRLSDGPDDLRSREIGRLDRGDEVEVIGEYDGMLNVRTPTGQLGWVPRVVIVG